MQPLTMPSLVALLTLSFLSGKLLLQTPEAPVVAIGQDVGRIDRQVHRLDDARDDGLLSQDAPVSAQ